DVCSSDLDAVQHLDPTDPESMNQMFSGSMFIPEPEGAQKAAIDHLETLLALIEGWVDVVVTEAAKPLDSANALREMINRRRASGGPAEHAFGSLVGLDLRPRRLHDATKLWMTIQEAEGIEYRDAIWESQLRLPTDEDLDDPEGYIPRQTSADEQSATLDDDLKKLLEGGFDDDQDSKNRSSASGKVLPLPRSWAKLTPSRKASTSLIRGYLAAKSRKS